MIRNPYLFPLLLIFGCMAPIASEAETPNILFILVDDQGYGDLERHGNPSLKTPNIDQLHDQSARFTNFHVSPSCAPSRCALMSGKHEFKSGVTHTIMPGRNMDLKTVTLADVLKSAGYVTGMFGKWHLGHDGPYRAENRGFDVALTCPEDSQKFHFDPELLRNNVPEKHQGYRTDIFYDEAMKFISENRDKKFFCYIPSYTPHAPLEVPEEYSEQYKDLGDRLSHYFGMVANVDKNVGRVLKHLEDLGLDKKTLVVYITDNGGTFGVDHHNAGMRGCKGSTWYGGTRAMSFWRWPNKFKAQAHDSLTAHYDVFPTLASIAKAEVPIAVSSQWDGISLQPLLESKTDSIKEERYVVTHMARWKHKAGQAILHKYFNCSVQDGRYLLHRVKDCGQEVCPGHGCRTHRRVHQNKKALYAKFFHVQRPDSEEWQLFDINNDPLQMSNIADNHQDLVAKMSAHYEDWWKTVYPHVKIENSQE